MDLEALKAQLRSDEGLSLKPKGDAKDSIQIGYGHNLTFSGISKAIAEQLLDEDLDLILATLPIRWPPFLKLDDVRQQVICNMAYNLGLNGLMLFTHMLAACAREDFDTAANEIENSAAAKQTGSRYHRLATQMRHGA